MAERLYGSYRADIARPGVSRTVRSPRVRPSTGSVGDAYDNAMAESFFASLEWELIDRNSFTTKTEARLALFSYIEGWYNPRRRHSALGQSSPIDYERSAEHDLTTAGVCLAGATPQVDKSASRHSTEPARIQAPTRPRKVVNSNSRLKLRAGCSAL